MDKSFLLLVILVMAAAIVVISAIVGIFGSMTELVPTEPSYYQMRAGDKLCLVFHKGDTIVGVSCDWR